MDKLNQLLTGTVRDFAVAFGSATREWSAEAPAPGYPVWLEGWIAPAQAGYVMGDGEFIYKGVTRRFYFSGPPLRHSQGVRLSGAGTVSSLQTLRDFSGVYLPWDGAPSRRGSAAEALMKNGNGVVIALIASEEDRMLELPYGGLRIRLATDL